MYAEFIRLIITLAFAIVGNFFYTTTIKYFEPYSQSPWWGVLFVLGFSGIGYLLGGMIGRQAGRVAQGVERALREIPGVDFFLTVFGLLVGLLVSSLISLPFLLTMSTFGIYISFFSFFFFGTLGVYVSWHKRREILSLVLKEQFVREEISLKLLDTSVIVDGRIAELTRLGYLESKIIVPRFVLKEVQGLVDSSDEIKRARGQRALGILDEMKKNGWIEIVDRDPVGYPDVDSKLIAVAKELGAVLITTDYGLNRVASIEGVRVLNLNDLANALKPDFLPGEIFTLKLVKVGKEKGQGVGYLDDGTMVVVEEGKNLIGQEVSVEVTGLLQTSAGKIVFSRIQEASN